MSLLLPVDDNGNPMQVLGFDPRGTIKLAVTGSASHNVTPLPSRIQLITLIATGPCRFEIGGAEVVADLNSSPFLYPGVYVDVPLKRHERYVSFIAEAEDCVAYLISRV